MYYGSVIWWATEGSEAEIFVTITCLAALSSLQLGAQINENQIKLVCLAHSRIIKLVFVMSLKTIYFYEVSEKVQGLKVTLRILRSWQRSKS